MPTMTKVLFAVTGSDHWTLADGTRHASGYWPEELATPHRIFTEAGFDVTFATPGGVVPVDDKAGYAPEMNGGDAAVGQSIADYIASIADELKSVKDLDTLDPSDFDILFIPGGHGPMEDLAVSEKFGAMTRAFAEAGKPVAAVCHGPAALLAARDDNGDWLFSGYRVTGFSNIEETQVGFADVAKWLLEDRLKSDGGIFSAAAQPWAEHLVVDRNLYTGQNPASSEVIARRLVADA